MKYILLDESGELGFKESSSKFFIITLLTFDESVLNNLRRIIKKVRFRKLKKKLKNMPELKGYTSSDSVREFVLKRISLEKVEIFTIVLDKSKVYDYLKNKKDKIYNYTTNLILNECDLSSGSLKLIVDRSYKKFLALEFNRYIKQVVLNKDSTCKIEIIHEDSKKESALQALDFVSWAIFRKYESGEERFYDLIKNKIVTEKRMFNGP